MSPSLLEGRQSSGGRGCGWIVVGVGGETGGRGWVQQERAGHFCLLVSKFLTIKLTWRLIRGSTSVCKFLFIKDLVHVAFLLINFIYQKKKKKTLIYPFFFWATLIYG